MFSCHMAPSHVQCPSRDGQQNPCSWLITVIGQHSWVTTHKISACRLQWVGPIHPCTPRTGLLGYLHSLHSNGSVNSGAERCVVPEGQVKGYMWERSCQIWILHFHLTEREAKNTLVAQARTECHFIYRGRMGKEECGLDSAGSWMSSRKAHSWL